MSCEEIELLIWGFIRLFYEDKHSKHVASSIKHLCGYFCVVIDSKILSISQQFVLWKDILCKSVLANSGILNIELLVKMEFESPNSLLSASQFNKILDGKDNLLIVFEHAHNGIFGVYLEYHWNSAKDKFGQNSFLFCLQSENESQAKPIIFPRRREIDGKCTSSSCDVISLYAGNDEVWDMEFQCTVDESNPSKIFAACRIETIGNLFNYYRKDLLGADAEENCFEHDEETGWVNIKNMEIFQIKLSKPLKRVDAIDLHDEFVLLWEQIEKALTPAWREIWHFFTENDWLKALNRLDVDLTKVEMAKVFKLMDPQVYIYRQLYIDEPDFVRFCRTIFYDPELRELQERLLEDLRVLK